MQKNMKADHHEEYPNIWRSLTYNNNYHKCGK